MLSLLNKIEYLKICFKHALQLRCSVPKRVFSFAMLRIQDNFGNLPLFISEVSWILTHNLN